MNMRPGQDLHLHTIYSKNDSAIVPEQTMELISKISHAEVIGVSDHLEHMNKDEFGNYRKQAKHYGFLVGTEVDGPGSVDYAIEVEPEYYVYHCFNSDAAYKGAERLLATGKPLIIAHPMMLDTDLNRLPSECFIEISNRYVWRNNWRKFFTPYLNRFRFVLSSDAHQPLMLNQTVARYVGKELGIKESMVFP